MQFAFLVDGKRLFLFAFLIMVFSGLAFVAANPDIVAHFANPSTDILPGHLVGHSSADIVVNVSGAAPCSGNISLQSAIDNGCFGGSLPSGSTPIGSIVMYSGAWAFDATGKGTGSLSGWALCNGNNGTPNLSDKFVMGTTSSPTPGATGGTATHTHAAGTFISAAHSHTISSHTHSVSTHTHSYSGTTGSSGSESEGFDDTYFSTLYYAPDNHTHSYSGTTSSSGSGTTSSSGGGSTSTDGSSSISGTSAASSSLPPYIKLAFIMKTA